MATATLTELHAAMMAKADELWRRARRSMKERDDDEAEKWEACAMVAEECAGLVLAANTAAPVAKAAT